MRISVRRTGGFAGTTESLADADTLAMEPRRAKEVEEAVQQANFFDLPERVGESIGADMFQYEVTISDAGKQHTVSFVEDEGSPAAASLRTLVSTLT